MNFLAGCPGMWYNGSRRAVLPVSPLGGRLPLSLSFRDGAGSQPLPGGWSPALPVTVIYVLQGGCREQRAGGAAGAPPPANLVIS